jgi:5-methylcytosine-specific restriction enzyme subunit McrC
MESAIPIQNIYYLLSYAWGHLDERDLVDIAANDTRNVAELLARVLISRISSVIRRGLYREYLPANERLSGIKGKLEIAQSLQSSCLRNAKAVCTYDELTHNVVHNQIIRTTLKSLMRTREIKNEIAKELAKVYRKLQGVDEISLSPAVFTMARIHKNNRNYDLLLKICRLVYESLLPTERRGELKFVDFVRDHQRLSIIFERFVRNFYSTEQDLYTVARDTLKWHGVWTDVAGKHLPSMITDMSLSSQEINKKIIIDTKFFHQALSKGQHSEDELVRSGNLYQLMCYIQNSRATSELEHEGMLLYPSTGHHHNLEYNLWGHRIRVCTINLKQSWKLIHEDLLKLLA